MTRAKKERARLSWLLYFLLFMGAVTMVFPIIWTLLSSFKTPSEIMAFPPTMLPRKPTVANYRDLLKAVPFARYYLNSAIVAVISTFAVLITSALGGFLFDKYSFPGKSMLFILVLANLMIPFEVILVPLFRIAHTLNLTGNYWGMILPFIVSPFGLYLMRQFCHEIPTELMEAAFIDGCSDLRTFFLVILPQMRPALSALAIFTFMGSWNSYIWPLVVIDSKLMRTLPVGLAAMQSDLGTRYGLVMAGTTLSIWPVVVVFLLAQRQFIQGLAMTGLKA